MKTKKTLSVYLATLLLFFLFTITIAVGQSFTNGNFGLRISNSISANRFGPVPTTSVFYKTGRHTFITGIMFCAARSKMDGFQTNYEYTLLDKDVDENCYYDWLGLYCFFNTGYHNKAVLGKPACEEERISNKELQQDPTEIRMRSIEAYSGIGLRIIFFKNFYWFNSIGIGGYTTLSPTTGLAYNKRAIGLLFRTGIAYRFTKIKRQAF